MLMANMFCRAAWKTNRPSPLPRSTNVRPSLSLDWMVGLCRILSHITFDDRENVGRYGAPLLMMTGGRLRSSPRFATNPIARPALTAGCIWDEVKSCSLLASSGLWVPVVVDVVLSFDSKSSSPRDDNNSFSSRLISVWWEGIAIVEACALCLGLCRLFSSYYSPSRLWHPRPLFYCSLSVARPSFNFAG